MRIRPRRLVAWASAALSLIAPRIGFAHGPLPSKAPVFDPAAPGVIADQCFTIRWTDFDKPIRTGTATVDLFYVRDNTTTFVQGDRPPALVHTSSVIVRGILEKDPKDLWVWNTSTIAPGAYWIWSYVNDPPAEFGTLSFVSFSPFPVTIQHHGSALPPYVVITNPDSPIRFADDHFQLKYVAVDPDHSAHVRLEWTESLDGSNLQLLADNLEPYPCAIVEWDTLCLPESPNVVLKATITDARGMSFESWSRYFLLITHLAPPDAGCALSDASLPPPTATRDPNCAPVDVGTDPCIDVGIQPDAEAVPDASSAALDGGTLDGSTSAPKKGCSCDTAHDHRGDRPLSALVLPIALAFARRRERV
jgi:hypothetical protein